MTTVKTVAYIVQWVHMCPTACKWHPTSYKWKQLTSNPKTLTWTSHELTSQEMKIPKLLQLANTYKPMNSFCKMFGQFCKQNWKTLATVSPASVSSPELTASIVSWTASAMKTCTSSNKTARRSKTTNAFKFKWLANLCPSHFLDLYSVSKLTAIEVASRVPLWLSFCLSGGSFLGRPRWLPTAATFSWNWLTSDIWSRSGKDQTRWTSEPHTNVRHVWLFEEPITILFNYSTQHRTSIEVLRLTRSVALPCFWGK